MKKYLVSAAAIVVLAAGGFALKDPVFERVGRYLGVGQPEPVPVFRLEARNYRVVVPVRGELTGLEVAPVQVPQLAAGVVKIAWLADEGAIVDAGDPIVRFDDSDALLSLEENENQLSSYGYQIEQSEYDARGEQATLEADREVASLELDFSENQVRRDATIFSEWEIRESLMSAALARYKQRLLDQKGGLQSTLSEADLKILNIEQGKAKREIETAQETLDSLTIRSDKPGVVLYQRLGFDALEAGTSVYSGQRLMEIARLDRYRAKVQIPEQDIPGVDTGLPVAVRLDAYPAEPLSGIVEAVARVANQIDRTDPRKYFEVLLALDVDIEMMSRMKPGMALAAGIEIDREEKALVVPRSAVSREADGFVIFEEREGEFLKHSIDIVVGDHGFYVIEGVSEGIRVCLRNPFQKQELYLPDFNAQAARTQSRSVIFFD